MIQNACLMIIATCTYFELFLASRRLESSATTSQIQQKNCSLTSSRPLKVAENAPVPALNAAHQQSRSSSLSAGLPGCSARGSAKVGLPPLANLSNAGARADIESRGASEPAACQEPAAATGFLSAAASPPPPLTRITGSDRRLGLPTRSARRACPGASGRRVEGAGALLGAGR